MTLDDPDREANRPPSDRLTTFSRLSSAVGRLLAHATSHVRVEGLADLPDEVRQGPLIVASNHASNADAILVAAWVTPALGRMVRWMTKAEALRWPIVGRIIEANGAFGIRRGAADVEAFRAARRILDDGGVLGLFPEGTRSPTGALQQVKEGTTLLALRANALILPVGIGGAHRLWPKGGGVHPGARIVLRVGRPFRLGELPRGADRRAAMRSATDVLMFHIAELLPPSQRGAYADLVRQRVARPGGRGGSDQAGADRLEPRQPTSPDRLKAAQPTTPEPPAGVSTRSVR